jgi:hypothetical protein
MSKLWIGLRKLKVIGLESGLSNFAHVEDASASTLDTPLYAVIQLFTVNSYLQY